MRAGTITRKNVPLAVLSGEDDRAAERSGTGKPLKEEANGKRKE
jgi:hypothetical protein